MDLNPFNPTALSGSYKFCHPSCIDEKLRHRKAKEFATSHEVEPGFKSKQLGSRVRASNHYELLSPVSYFHAFACAVSCEFLKLHPGPSHCGAGSEF